MEEGNSLCNGLLRGGVQLVEWVCSRSCIWMLLVFQCVQNK